ncbi:MAG: methyltransferase domain-containing protein [Chitinophagaceae bacterium]|nr:methyltransferase domain-containing protein [Chitinophagaceae bacterium]
MDHFSSYFEANKELWNKRTAVHKDSNFYDLAAFREGKDVLTPIETSELGDVKGKTMLHLQCHFGMDSLNWVRRGARVTGVDMSDEAVKEARKLNDELALDAKFICCNVYDLPEHLDEKFDIVFTSYGVVGWLPDLEKWAQIIKRYLKPGGIFYMAEFHPVVWMFDDEFTHIKYHYDNREIIVTESEGTYTDREADIQGKEYSWNHSISEVLNALLSQGLRIEQFNEFTYSPYPCFNNIVQGDDGNWRVRGMEGKIPMVYSVRAVRG